MAERFSTAIDVEEVIAGLVERGVNWVQQIEYFETLPSSNDYVLALSEKLHGHVCITDFQSRGKGRHGRRWHGSSGTNLMFTLGWSPAGPLTVQISPLVGVAVADALLEAGLSGVQLKWPNDVLVAHRKLAGILIESRVQGGLVEMAIGIGLNIYHHEEDMTIVERPWTDLRQQGMGEVDRSRLLVAILARLAHRFEQFEREGFAPIRDDWHAYHAYQGEMMRYHQQGQACIGRAIGMDEQGALLFESDRGEVVAVHSDEVNSLRVLV